MKIKELFEKDIFRPIETVIKADDRENISSEVAEYVITDEISKKIGNFFEAYCDYTGANGVWISGFFGSGKSHLLKILSYVLENKEYDGYKAGELFAEKVENDKLLQANIHKAARIPSESILFNIDQQSQIKAKEDADAILSVFYKVFYDHLGFYGFRPHVAEFEMWLDTQDRYHEFKDAFDQRHPQSWEEARKNYFDPDVEDDMAAACGTIFKNDPEKYQDILSKLEDKEKQSIEDFCNRVADYIASKPKGFRINFFVDEIGQYISDNTKLMLNLQTVAETLATKTGGNSWILVTSQSDMETVMGDLTDKQGNDFSRIQARFAIKLPLTSANVDEVIEKRLLDKKEAQQAALLKTYEKESSHLSSLLSFSDAGRQFKGYKSDTDFARKYPFAPYQFDLFQECRRALAQHNVFQGRHASVGERSMLGVFQQVVKSLGDEDDRTLVTFDLMYQGISSELRPEIQTTFGVAKKNLDKPLALKVLKALFLVKYFGSFKATKRNVYVMLIGHLDIDLAKHQAAIDEALNILENQSYIQRNGEFYEFLTDDEKDIEQEIKNTTIDDGKVTSFLNEVLFNEIVKDARLKYLKNNQEYEFTRSVDGVAFSRARELEIEFISQDYDEGYGNIEALSQQTMGSKKLRMVLPAMETFIRDIKMHIKTEKYARQSRGNTSKPEVTRILNEKTMQNAARRRDLIEQAKKAMADSVVYVNGTKQELNATSDPKTRVINAFQILIATVYPNLRMLKDVPFSEQTIKTIVFENQDDLFTGDDAVISEAETEMLNFIDRRKSQSDRTSLTDIKSHFTTGSYGWYPNAIWTIAAKLYKRGKIEFRQDAQTLEDSDVHNALLTSTKQANTLLQPQAVFDHKVVHKLKDIYKEAFDETCTVSEAKDVAKAFKDKLKETHVEVNQLLAQRTAYPFLESLRPFNEELEKWSQKEYAFFLDKAAELEDPILDFKEDLLHPIKKFLNGEQRNIYDAVKTTLDGNTANFTYIQSDELDTLKTLVGSKTPYKGNGVQLAKAALDTIREKVTGLIDAEKSDFLKAADEQLADIKGRADYSELSSEKQRQLVKTIEDLKGVVAKERYISNIRQQTDRLPDLHTDALNKLNKFVVQETTGDKVAEPEVQWIRMSRIHIKFDKKELVTEEELEAYLEALRTEYLKRIKDNTKIVLN